MVQTNLLRNLRQVTEYHDMAPEMVHALGAAMLHVTDLRTPPPADCPRFSVPDVMVKNLTPLLKEGGGEFSGQWHVKVDHKYPDKYLFDLPGTAGDGGVRIKSCGQNFAGIRFEVSAIRGSTKEPACLIGWVALHQTIVSEMFDDITTYIERHSQLLGSLCHLQGPAKPSPIPWLAVLRMPPWREMASEERDELSKLYLCIGWAAIELFAPQRSQVI